MPSLAVWVNGKWIFLSDISPINFPFNTFHPLNISTAGHFPHQTFPPPTTAVTEEWRHQQVPMKFLKVAIASKV
jgi:hypothetical protein